MLSGFFLFCLFVVCFSSSSLHFSHPFLKIRTILLLRETPQWAAVGLGTMASPDENLELFCVAFFMFRVGQNSSVFFAFCLEF